MFRTLIVASAAIGACAAPARAAETDPPTIVVTGEQPKLDRKSDTGSRLGLSVRETPATLETLTRQDMQARGLRTAREAFDSVAGAIAGSIDIALSTHF